MDNWISVDTDSPSKGDIILVCIDKRVDPQAVFLHQFHSEGKAIIPRVREVTVREVGDDGEGNYIEVERDCYENPNHITHWMKMPQPPKGS